MDITFLATGLYLKIMNNYHHSLLKLTLLSMLKNMSHASIVYTLRKKGTKAVTGAVPFQKIHFCTQRLHIGTLVVHIST